MSLRQLALLGALVWAIGCGRAPDPSTGGADATTGGFDTAAGDPDASAGGLDGTSGGQDAPTGDPDGPAGGPDAMVVTSDAPAGSADAPAASPDAPAASPDGPAGAADAASDPVPADVGLPGGGPDASVVPGVPREVDGLITINEFMTYNAVTILDDTGGASDWLELHNPTDRDIPLGGYALTDVLALPRKSVIPAGVVLPARGYLLFWLDHAPERGPRHMGFHLRREGGDIGLARPDGSSIDRIVYGNQEVDFAMAREPDGSSHWQLEWHPTPGAANRGGPGVPVGPEVVTSPPESIPAVGDLSERILGYDVLLQLAIVVTPAGAASLEAAPFKDVPGTLVFDGRSYGPVGVRLKGQNSFQPFSQKPSLRINIDEYVPRARFFGLKDLTLNNMDNDLSMVHERLAYRVARQAEIPASRANHALVTVNGAFYGLYTNVETVKRRMVRRWFSNATGPLFEATDGDFIASEVSGYELESGPNDRSLLTGLVNAMTIADPNAAIAAAGSYANMSQYRRFWAMESVIGQFDSIPYSNPGDDILVYADPGSGRLWFLPWGMDETFYSSSFSVTQVHSVLARRCKDSPACYQNYADQTWDLLALTEAMNLEAELARIRAQIAPYVALDTRKPYSDSAVAASQDSLRWFIVERRAKLTGMLPPRSP